jgi:hypothetical protein
MKQNSIHWIPTMHWWLTPVILATEEAEIRKIVVPSQPWQTVYEILSQKTQHKNRTGRVAQVVECLPSMRPRV